MNFNFNNSNNDLLEILEQLERPDKSSTIYDAKQQEFNSLWFFPLCFLHVVWWLVRHYQNYEKFSAWYFDDSSLFERTAAFGKMYVLCSWCVLKNRSRLGKTVANAWLSGKYLTLLGNSYNFFYKINPVDSQLYSPIQLLQIATHWNLTEKNPVTIEKKISFNFQDLLILKKIRDHYPDLADFIHLNDNVSGTNIHWAEEGGIGDAKNLPDNFSGFLLRINTSNTTEIEISKRVCRLLKIRLPDSIIGIEHNKEVINAELFLLSGLRETVKLPPEVIVLTRDKAITKTSLDQFGTHIVYFYDSMSCARNCPSLQGIKHFEWDFDSLTQHSLQTSDFVEGTISP
jgi:hypothetical protein